MRRSTSPAGRARLRASDPRSAGVPGVPRPALPRRRVVRIWLLVIIGPCHGCADRKTEQCWRPPTPVAAIEAPAIAWTPSRAASETAVPATATKTTAVPTTAVESTAAAMPATVRVVGLSHRTEEQTGGHRRRKKCTHHLEPSCAGIIPPGRPVAKNAVPPEHPRGQPIGPVPTSAGVVRGSPPATARFACRTNSGRDVRRGRGQVRQAGAPRTSNADLARPVQWKCGWQLPGQIRTLLVRTRWRSS